MPYRAFRESYRRTWLECPLGAFLLWRRYAERHCGLSPRLDTQAALAVYESEPAVKLLQGGRE